jgi:hypothetical protein
LLLQQLLPQLLLLQLLQLVQASQQVLLQSAHLLNVGQVPFTA